MAVSIFLFANLTIVVGCCLGWAWGAAGMAAALRARDQVFLAQQLQRTQSDVAGATNPEGEYQRIIFQGRFLDPKSSAVFGVFLCTGAYFAAVMQVKLPKLKIAAIFFCIVLDVLCTYGPLFPFQQYTLATIFLIPIGCSVAISLACSFLIFPRTLNYGWQLQLVKTMRLGQSILAVHRDALARVASPSETDTPSEVEAQVEPKLRTMLAGFIGLAQALGGQIGFLELEVAYGRLSAKDLSGLYTSLRQAGVKLLGLNAFLHLFEGVDLVDENVQEPETKESLRQKGGGSQGSIQLHETHQLLRYRKMILSAERKNHVELKTVLAILEEAARPPLEAADNSLSTMAAWFEESANRKRTYRHDEWVSKLKASIDSLEASCKVFVEQERFQLIRPYMHLFKKHEGGSFQSEKELEQYIPAENRAAFRRGARPLYTSLVFAANLCVFTEGLIQLNRSVYELASKRPKNRLWFPTGLRKIGNILVSKTANTGGAFRVNDGHAPEDADLSEQSSLSPSPSSSDDFSSSDTVAGPEHQGKRSDFDAEKGNESQDKQVKGKKRHTRSKAPKDADALAPTSSLHHIGRTLSAVFDFVWSPTGVYALKFSIVSFALWLPSVIPSSAGFVYLHRGLWALIMGQTGLAVLGGEFIFSLLSRVLGTGVGIVLGMLLWYISTGLGNGNPYGMAATCAVAFIPMMFMRVYAPPAVLVFSIMFNVTAVLVVGYSWIDSHLTVLANSGIGYDVAWRRGLLVLIGVAAAFIVTIFPRPASTRAMVRETFARNTTEIARLYSIVIEAWIVVRENDGQSKSKVVVTDKRADEGSNDLSKSTTELLADFRNRFVASQGTLAYLDQQIKMASLDFPIRGRWPKERYEELLAVQARMLESLSQLSSAITGLDEVWRLKTLQYTAILDPRIISEISMTLALVGQALKTGTPLPHAFQNLLETTLHFNSVAHAIEFSIRRQQNEQGLTDGLAKGAAMGQEGAKEERQGGNDLDLSLTTLRDPQFMRHAAALMALIQFVRQIDRFKAIVSDLVGEVALPGFDRLKDTYDDRISRAFLNNQ